MEEDSEVTIIGRQYQVVLHTKNNGKLRPSCFIQVFVNGKKAILYSLNGNRLDLFVKHLDKVLEECKVEEVEAVMEPIVQSLLIKVLDKENYVLEVGEEIKYDGLIMNVITIKRKR